MKVAIVFYSFSGNTKNVCLFLERKLSTENHNINLIELRLRREETAFLKQCYQAFTKKSPELLGANYDLAGYDFIVFASPVWAFTFTPALRSYLEKTKGLEDKKIACLLTFGSGAGINRVLNELAGILKEKKARILFSRNLQGKMTNEDSYLEKHAKTLLEIIGQA